MTSVHVFSAIDEMLMTSLYLLREMFLDPLMPSPDTARAKEILACLPLPPFPGRDDKTSHHARLFATAPDLARIFESTPK
jgi:hypothetical protein